MMGGHILMIHSFLLIGQSNMAGRGNIAQAHEIKTQNIQLFRSGRWTSFHRPVQPDRSFSGVNLAESFAEKYAQEHGVTVGLIPCADGGTCLDQWQEGSLLYDNAVNCARLAQRTSTIAGVLWHQGESDCHDGRSGVYYEKLEKIFAALRRDLDLYDVPFILGGLGDFIEIYGEGSLAEGFKVVNPALERYASEHEMTGFADASGLKPNDDNLHFCSDALYEFGLRYYEEFRKLENKNKVFTEKATQDSAIRTQFDAL